MIFPGIHQARMPCRSCCSHHRTQGRIIPDFRMICKSHRRIRGLENFGCKGSKHLLGSNFNKQSGPFFVKHLQALDPSYRRSDLACQPVQVGLHGGRIIAISHGIHVGDKGNSRWSEVQTSEYFPQRTNGRGYHEGMESMGHIQFHGFYAHGCKFHDQLLHGLGSSGNYRLAPRVVIGYDDAVYVLYQLHEFFSRCKNSSHLSHVIHPYT